MRRRRAWMVMVVFLIGVSLSLTWSVGCAEAQLRISYPSSNSTVPGPVIVLRGVGADPAGTLEVQVLTNEWYLQTGRPMINSDGSWSYSPCNLGGQGQYNNHTIQVTIIRDGRRGESAEVTGIVRR